METLSCLWFYRKMKMLLVFVILCHAFHHVLCVEVLEGAASVVLPCQISSVPRGPTVMWSRNELSPSTIHRRKENGDDLKDQNLCYSGQTSMETDTLKTGDLSLTLRRPSVSDSGNYSCTITAFGNERRLADVELKVKELKTLPVDVSVLLSLLIISLVAIVILGVYLWRSKTYVRRLKNKATQVAADSGVESVLLLCTTTAKLSENVRVEWRDRNYRTVHVYENGSDQPEEQDWFYRGRTEMMTNLLGPGDISLRLKYPTDKDTGTFTCTVYNKDRKILMKKQVELKVKVCEVEVEEGAESVLLPFRTTGNLPEDATVQWIRYEPKHMEVHKYQNGSDQLGEQNQFYRDRTEMKENLLETGDLSLILKNPTVGDTGRYICLIKNNSVWRYKTVQLKVKAENPALGPDEPLMAEQSV